MSRWILALLCLPCVLSTATPAVSLPLPERGAGVSVDLPAAPGAVALFPTRGPASADDAASPTTVLRVRVRWVDVEAIPGLADWSVFDRLLEAARRRGVPLVVTLTGPGPDGVGVPVAEGDDLDSWLAFVSEAARRADGRVAGWEIWEAPNDPASWGRPPSVAELAFLVKKTALVLRGIDPAARVATGAIRSSPTFLDDVFAEGVAPFVAAHAIDARDSENPERVLEQFFEVALARDPSASTWVHAPLAPSTSPSVPAGLALWRQLLDAMAAPQDLTFFDAPVDDPAARAGIAAALASFAEAMPGDAAPSVPGARPLVAAPGESDVRWTRHLVASDLSQRVVFEAPPSAFDDSDDSIDIEVRDLGAGSFRLHEPTGRHAGPIRRVIPSSNRGAMLLSIPRAEHPLVLSFERGAVPPGQEEALQVTAKRELTVEEILARHLVRQAARDRSLKTHVADLSTDMRYQLGASQRGVSVRVESRYFHEAGGATEIENLRYFVNGAPYEPKRGVPEIPLLQPEKVTVGPLEIHLDRTYAYALEGTDAVGGRPAWKISYRPLEEDALRLAGTVWIDQETFDRLKLRSVQTRLEPPILSNTQTDWFVAVVGADGVEHLVVGDSQIERVVSVVGASVVVRMDLDFDDHRINTPRFRKQREEALASENQMLRDTEEGYLYLSRTEGGERVLSRGDSRKLLAVGGARYDGSYDGILPLAGVNWLDHDFRGRGLQLNLFLAGAINTVSLFDPSLFGGELSGGFNAFLPVVRLQDRLAVPGGGVDESRSVRAHSPSVRFELGTPLGRFGKTVVGVELEHQAWSDTDDTAADFVEPADTFVTTGDLGFEYHRGAWDLRTRLGYSHRFDWDPWGPDGGTLAPEFFEEGDEDYWTWQVGLAGTWLTDDSLRIGVALDYLDGDGLDRFSQYEFSGFVGPSAAGFAGSGIHFDRAALLRLSYGFDVFGVLGLEGFVDYGILRNNELPDDVVAVSGREGDILGVGITGTVPGPWSTLVQFEIGHALHAEDYPAAEGDFVAQVLFLKVLR